MKKIVLLITAFLLAGAALAKLPPLSDDAKAKAAEAAAKTAHGNKIADYQLCLSREKAAAHFFKTAKASGKETKPATETPPCTDPGAFVYPPPAALAVAGAPATPTQAVAAATTAKSAAPTTPVKK